MTVQKPLSPSPTRQHIPSLRRGKGHNSVEDRHVFLKQMQYNYISLMLPGPRRKGSKRGRVYWLGRKLEREVREQMEFQFEKFLDDSPEILVPESMERYLVQHPSIFLKNLKVQMKIKYVLSDKSPCQLLPYTVITCTPKLILKRTVSRKPQSTTSHSVLLSHLCIYCNKQLLQSCWERKKKKKKKEQKPPQLHKMIVCQCLNAMLRPHPD